MYVIAREKGTRRNHSNIDLQEHAVFALFSCLFSETQARTNSQVHLFPSVPCVVAIFSLQKRLLSFLLSLCHIEPALLEFFSVSSGNDALPGCKAAELWAHRLSVGFDFLENVWVMRLCYEDKAKQEQLEVHLQKWYLPSCCLNAADPLKHT